MASILREGIELSAARYIEQAINYFKSQNISWLAWTWQTGSCSGPSLLADWSGKPSIPYGSFIQRQMQAAAAANS